MVSVDVKPHVSLVERNTNRTEEGLIWRIWEMSNQLNFVVSRKVECRGFGACSGNVMVQTEVLGSVRRTAHAPRLEDLWQTFVHLPVSVDRMVIFVVHNFQRHATIWLLDAAFGDDCCLILAPYWAVQLLAPGAMTQS